MIGFVDSMKSCLFSTATIVFLPILTGEAVIGWILVRFDFKTVFLLGFAFDDFGSVRKFEHRVFAFILRCIETGSFFK